MMTQRLILRLSLRSLVTSLAGLFLLSSCAGVPLTESGFLGDYSQVLPNKDLQVWGIPDGVRIYRSDKLDSGGYDAIHVEPAVWLPSDQHHHRPSEKKSSELAAQFSDCLRKGLGKDFEVVDAPRRGALTVRPALTAVDPSRWWINIPAIVFAVPLDMGGLSGEIEVVDSISGERVLAMTARRESNIFLLFEFFDGNYGQVRHGMWKWSRLLAKQLLPPKEDK